MWQVLIQLFGINKTAQDIVVTRKHVIFLHKLRKWKRPWVIIASSHINTFDGGKKFHMCTVCFLRQIVLLRFYRYTIFMNHRSRMLVGFVTMIGVIGALFFVVFKPAILKAPGDVAPLGDVDCKGYSSDSCPAGCSVCPPCPECNSVGCRAISFCAGSGFEKDWYEKVRHNDTDVKKGNTDACGIESCHGLDIVCGSKVPEVCTDMYALGDKCRQYAKCETVGGKCQLAENSKFTQCKKCAESCNKKYSGDPVKAFACESGCK